VGGGGWVAIKGLLARELVPHVELSPGINFTLSTFTSEIKRQLSKAAIYTVDKTTTLLKEFFVCCNFNIEVARLVKSPFLHFTTSLQSPIPSLKKIRIKFFLTLN